MAFLAVVTTPDKGRGLIVTKTVPAGTLLLAEAPFALAQLCRPPPATAALGGAFKSGAGSCGLLGLGEGRSAPATDAFNGAVVGRCHACLAEASSAVALKRCPKCHLVEYCSTACQVTNLCVFTSSCNELALSCLVWLSESAFCFLCLCFFLYPLFFYFTFRSDESMLQGV
jgi:hypothetical protein